MKLYRATLTAVITLAVLMLSQPALGALQPGAQAPMFTIQASFKGEAFSFSLQQALGEGPVVVYFFPSAYTHGCDVEAHTFAVNQAKFEAAGASIVGVSADAIKRLNHFSADPDFCAGKFPVASDPNGKVAATYGLDIIPAQEGMTDVRGDAIEHGFIPRTTFVIDESGEIVAVFSSSADHLTPRQHVHESLAIVQNLAAHEPRR